MGSARYVAVALVMLLVVMGSCGKDNSVTPADTVPPSPPLGVMAAADAGTLVRISWDPNTELDLAGYRLYRSSNETGPFGPATSTTLVCPWYYAQTMPMEVTFFKVTAVDRSGNESAYSDLVAVFTDMGKHGGSSNHAGQ